MQFAIQYNLMNEKQMQLVRVAVAPYSVNYVHVRPFDHEITGNQPIVGQDYIPYGSTLLTTLASELGWKGLHFDLEKMNYEHFLAHRKCMLNRGVSTARLVADFCNSCDPDHEFFLRPSLDLKQFAGCVMKAGEIGPWFQSMFDTPQNGGSYYMHPDTKIVLDHPKPIQAEWRWFIVGGKIVSGSMYRAHGQMRTIRELDPAVIAEAQHLADQWLPLDCVVMDTCLSSDVLHIVEFNCINSSGFYDNDVGAIFKALWEYHQ